LEELFEIMNTYSFEPFFHNVSTMTLNGIEIDAESFKNFAVWYAEWRSRLRRHGPTLQVPTFRRLTQRVRYFTGPLRLCSGSVT
jgi:hypothetical protein